MSRYIWSDSLEELIVKGFTFRGHHYTWNDLDMVWWRDDVDDRYYDDIPAGARLDGEVM